MKQTLFFCLGLLLFAACTHKAHLQPSIASKPQADTHSIRCLQVMHLSPEFNHLNEVTGFDTNYAHIYWRASQIQYVITYPYYIFKNVKAPWERIKEKHIRRLVFEEGSPDGAYYDERIMIYNQKVKADSILKDSWVGGPKILLFTNGTYDTLQASQQLPGVVDTLYESWGFGVKGQPTVYGKVQLYFIPYHNDLPYSIDTAAERAKGMRLCKLIAFIHSHTPGKNNAVNITLHNELKEVPVTNAAELLPYFERQKRGEYSVQVADVLKE
jgi:hypothetical protein